MKKFKTQIIASIAPTMSDENLLKILENGAFCVRLNTAFMDVEKTSEFANRIRKLSPNTQIMLDTKGPEIRTTHTKKDIEIKKHNIYFFAGNREKYSSEGFLYVDFSNFHKSLKKKDVFLIDDGKIAFKVEEVLEDKLACRAVDCGTISSFKSVNIPGISVDLPAVTPKDKKFFEFAIDEKIEIIAHSFIRSKSDLDEVNLHFTNSQFKPLIFSKIENRFAIENIESIIENSDGVIVARGDLGVETALEKIPILQKKITKLSKQKNKPVVVASQLLDTMIENSRPTRAEVSDVANAVIDGVDMLLLSGETAKGQYPVESVEMLRRIIIETEKSIYG